MRVDVSVVVQREVDLPNVVHLGVAEATPPEI